MKSSLHIAIRKGGANVHLDREGFVTSTNGRITYDLKQVINHLSTDLASDYVPILVASLTVKDDVGRTRFQGNLTAWLEVQPARVHGPRRVATRHDRGHRGLETVRHFPGRRRLALSAAAGGTSGRPWSTAR